MDLKTFEAMQVYGLTVATALTAQNTRGVSAIHPVPIDFIDAQLTSLFSDFKIAAIKTGLMMSEDMIGCVTTHIETHAPNTSLVIDPVISSTSGTKFLDDQALDMLKSRLAPIATLITPNLEEAARLLDCDPARDVDEMRSQAKALASELNVGAVLIKGGHLEGVDEATDILMDGEDIHTFSVPFVKTTNTHGTGCTLSAAVTAGLAKGQSLTDAVSGAKQFITNALQGSAHWHIGSGNGPLKHRGS